MLMKRIILLIYTFVIIYILQINIVYGYESYKVGDKVNYNGDDYYVIKSSNQKSSFITLMRDEPLKYSEIDDKYFEDVPDDFLFLPFSSDPIHCMNAGNYSSCTYNYDETNIKNYVDFWASNKIGNNNMVEVDGYKARLMNLQDMFNLGFGAGTVCDIEIRYCHLTLNSSYDYEWMNYENLSFWTMETNQYLNDLYLYSYRPQYNEFISNYQTYGKYVIRPVINLKKSNIDDYYSIGDKINLGNGNEEDDYYVISESESGQEYVTVLKYMPLKESDAGQEKAKDNYAKISFSESSNGCDSITNTSSCDADFGVSLVKKVLDEWINRNFDKNQLVEKDGYQYRLLTVDELKNDFGYVEQVTSGGNLLQATENTPSWIYDPSIFYWSMPVVDETYMQTAGYNGYLPRRINEYVIASFVLDRGQIRPVINLSKCALNDPQCGDCPDGIATYKEVIYYSEYNIGDIIKYNNEDYYVINTSSENENYVTVIKAKSLTTDELYKYGRDKNGHLFVNKYLLNENDPEKVIYSFSDGSGGIAYYTSETCRAEVTWNVSSFNVSNIISDGCENDFNKSDVKKVLANWSNDIFTSNDLIEVDGYKYRLLNLSDLNNLGFHNTYDNNWSISDLSKIAEPFKNNIPQYWTMISGEDNIFAKYSYRSLGIHINDSYVLTKNSVRPVVNINKCSIDGGCVKEKVLVSCDITSVGDVQPDNPSVVDVPSTLSIISNVIIIISLLLIISGIAIVVVNYKKSLSDKK